KSVYAPHEGFLETIYVKPGDQVKEGQILAQLQNIDVDYDIAKLTGQRDVYAKQLDGLNRMSLANLASSAQIKSVVEMLDSTKQQLKQRTEDRERLALVAPQAGTVLPAPLTEKQGDEAVHLSGWYGSPLEPENLGARLQTGTKLCQIGNPHSLEARVYIDQGDVEFVAAGQRVEIMLAQSAEVAYVSSIEFVSTENEKTTPTHLSSLH